MYKTLVKIGKFLAFNPIILIQNIFGLGWYFRDFRKIKRQLEGDLDFTFGPIYPILADKKTESGRIKGQYFHQDLLVAQRIFEKTPIRHIDVGSRVDGFVAHVASFRKIDVFDIRPLESKVDNIQFIQDDFINPVNAIDNSTDSLSCLHALEHFGLGRYGDPIDAYGHVKAPG